MQSHRRTFLSLRRHFLSTIKLNPPFSRSTSVLNQHSNPNSPSFSFSTSARHDHRRLGFTSLIRCNSTPLTPNWSSRSNFIGVRSFATRLAESNKPPKETIMLAGCDWEHWLVIVEEPDPKLSRDEIIDGYIKTLALVVGSEEEARMKIYSVSTRHYFAFGVLLQEEVAYKLKDLPHVRWVLPDSYLDVKNKTYAGEPFINGLAVPYDPKYHEIWVRNREASLKSNARNKNKRREPNSSDRGPRPSYFASLPGTPSENRMSSDVSENQSPPMSSVPSQNPERASSSAPSVSYQKERPSGHPLNQTTQNSQLPSRAPSALSHNQFQMQNQSSAWAQSPRDPSASQQNEMPSRSVNQTPQISRLPNRATSSFSHNQASQYPQMQNRSSGWAHSSHEPAVSHENEMPSAHPANQTPQTSRLRNRAPSSFSHNQASQYPQMQNRSSGWGHSSHEPAVSHENELRSAPPANQTPQTSQSPNRAPSSFSHNQASPYPQMRNRSSGWTRSSHEPAASQENEMPYAHPVNETPQTSQLPNRAPSSFSHNQASQYPQMQNRSSGWTRSSHEPAVPRENEMPSAHPVNQTPQTSQLRNRATSSFSHNQASQYPQMQNWSSGWTHSSHEPSPTMQPHHQSWQNQNPNWTPRVDYENHAAGGPSQIQNPSSRVFSENHTHHSQTYTHPSPWTPAPPTPSNTMGMNPPNWSPVQSQGRHPYPSQIQNSTRDPNYQSWGNQYQNRGRYPGQPAFSQSHTPEYSQMLNQSIQGSPQPPCQPYAVVDENRHNWNNRDWNTGVGPQSQVGVGHLSQMQNPRFSQSQAPQYSQSQVEPSTWATPNHQNWSSQNQNWTYVSSPYNLPNQSQSWEAAPQQQSRPLQSHDSPHNFSYDYSYRDTSHGVQTGGSQYGHPSKTFQHQAFHGGQSSNAVAPPQGWNHQNMTSPATQNNNFQSANVGPPQVHNHQFVSAAGKSRSIQNDNFRYKMGDPNQQAEYGETMPSYSNTGDRTQTREYQERDMPMDEEHMYGRR